MAVSLNKLAKAVDDYDVVREQRLAMDKEVAKLKEEESKLYNFLLDNIAKSDALGVVGKRKRATIKTSNEPTAEDWGKLYKHISKTGDFDLLQRRLSGGAVKLRWDEDKAVPGVGKIIVSRLSLTKP